ncbi:MAG: hypothetical protein ACFB4J_05540 [Elainellaceae cyanobacterium]
MRWGVYGAGRFVGRRERSRFLGMLVWGYGGRLAVGVGMWGYGTLVRLVTHPTRNLVWVDDGYRILVPGERFMEESAVGSREMGAFCGEVIGLPREEKDWPSLEGLRWHRERWGI